ncbi:hypothetical protein C4585_01415 [Candidatus Parcubacteria bacterium]|nr:MAG: hypothetical protein C4585_01415 [Candidatus Parcubacteria bacterium]
MVMLVSRRFDRHIVLAVALQERVVVTQEIEGDLVQFLIVHFLAPVLFEKHTEFLQRFWF